MENYKKITGINMKLKLLCMNVCIATSTLAANRSQVLEETPLHLVVIEEDVDAVQSLLEDGARVDVKDHLGTPLHYVALQKKNSEKTIQIARLLLEKSSKASLKIKDRYRRDPLDRALNNKNYDIAQLILERAAECFVYDKEEIELLIQDHPELGDAKRYRIGPLAKMEFKNS